MNFSATSEQFSVSADDDRFTIEGYGQFRKMYGEVFYSIKRMHTIHLTVDCICLFGKHKDKTSIHLNASQRQQGFHC